MSAPYNPYLGVPYAELCGRRKDYAKLLHAAVGARKAAERQLTLIVEAINGAEEARPFEASDHGFARSQCFTCLRHSGTINYRKRRNEMGIIVEKTVVVGPKEWREAGEQARLEAVSWLFDGNTKITSKSDRLKNAAELLAAADRFNGRANTMENFGEDPDTAVVEEWDLSDEMEGEDDEPIWPEMSAKLREVVGADPKLLPLVNHIDRLHKLAIENGMPVITRAQFEAATADTQ